MYTPPSDLRPLRTDDGSYTLRSEQLDEQYHSRHGAVQESRHVFIAAGLHSMPAGPVRILEVGLGTGLNALLTYGESLATGRSVAYTALEPYPLAAAVLGEMDHSAVVGQESVARAFQGMMAGPAGAWHGVANGFRFRRLEVPVASFRSNELYDLVYFDAFGPRVQPELWTEDVFGGLAAMVRPGGRLVTYCAKGAVRRALIATGWQVERLPGPPGKREMLRATRTT